MDLIMAEWQDAVFRGSMRASPGRRLKVAAVLCGGIILCPAAAVKSSWKSRFIPDISNRLRHGA
jgi:hypothetical protein